MTKNETLPAEYNALDPYTQAVFDEVYRQRLFYYRTETTFDYPWCCDRASEDATKAARIYNATGERIEFEKKN